MRGLGCRPGGIWEPLLRFIGVGILWTPGIIHGKVSLSGSVYTMRQDWQRWRPSTSGPSCLNMGLGHPTHKHHNLRRPLQHCSSQSAWCKEMQGSTEEQHRPSNIVLFFPFLCHPRVEQALCFEDFISICWRSHFIFTRLTTAPPRDLCLLKTWRHLVYSAIF